MKYTVRQMQEIVGLSKETYRHWKRVVPPITRQRGRTPSFTLGDLIAASILYRLTEKVGVRVGHLTDVAVALFKLCNTTPWGALGGSTITIDFDRRICTLDANPAPGSLTGIVLVCRLDPVLEQLRDALLRTRGDPPQSALRFPPTSLEHAADRRRRRA